MIGGFFQRGLGAIRKKLRGRGGFQAATSPWHLNRRKQSDAGKTKTKQAIKERNPMKTKHSITELDSRQRSTAGKKKRAAVKLAIRLTVVAALGLLSTLFPAIQTAQAQGPAPLRFDLVPASDAIANCMAIPNPTATVTVFLKEDVRGVDRLDLHAKGLRPNTTFAVFLTEMPVPPFGALQYIADFTTNADGNGSVRVDAIIEEAFAFNNVTGVRTDLNDVVFWFADPDDDEDCLPGSPATPFDGDGEAGVAAMSSQNFLPGAPLP